MRTMQMFRSLVFVLLLVIILLWITPFPKDNQDGAYNLTSQLAYCRTRTACLHEIGHALDQQAGWVSQSTEFYETLEMYLFVEIYQTGITILPASILEITYRGKGASGPIKRELYAYLFQQSEGDPNRMPEGLRRFFDWDAAQLLMATLDDDQVIYWMNLEILRSVQKQTH